MTTKLRQHLLATTLLVGAVAYANPAIAQTSTVADPSSSPDPTVNPPSGPVEAQPTPSVSAQGEPTTAPQDIVITGSRIPQPNLTSAAPVTVVSDQDIKLAGSTRIEDVLGQLPSATASQNSGLSNSATGTAEIDLRNLGSKRSLTLVNGRRLVPGDPNGTTQAADINLIPSALVKRVEVLTGGASSVYGADAVGGVVNFIMDTNFEGIRFDGNWSIWQHNQHNPSVGNCVSVSASQGYCAGRTLGDPVHINDILNARGYPIPGDKWDGRQLEGTVSLGAGFDDGRGHAVAYFGYRKVNPILQGSRDYSACVIQNTTAGTPRCGGSATAYPGNIFLFTQLNSTTSTTAALGPGTLTLGNGPNIYNFGPLNYFQRPDERYVAGAFANYEINDQIKPYLEFMFMDDRTLAQIAPSGDFFNTTSFNCDNPLMSAQQRAIICAAPNLVTGFLGNFPVAAGAPYNNLGPNGDPLTTPINFIDPITGASYNRGFGFLARRNVEGGPRISDLKHTTYRGVLGTRGDLSNVWSYDASFQYGTVKYTQLYKNDFSQQRLVNALDVVDDPRTPGVVDPVCRSVLTGTDPNCVPYDVFGPAGPSAASIGYLNVSGLITGQTSENIANVNFTGALGEWGMKTPWSDEGVGVNAGIEYRRESLELNPDALFRAGDLTGQGAPTLPIDGSFRVWEVFGEAQIPIIRNSIVEDLTFSLGYRKSWYELSNDRKYDTDTYKLSAEFAPVRDIRFRGSYNRAVRAPNIAELFSPPFVGLDGTKDPCAGIGPISLTNPDAADVYYGCVASGMTPGAGTPGNPAGQYNGLLGGNENLDPEKATTKTLGVVLQPRFLPRFALTVDYWDIRVKDAI
ncbi:MAG TPA: TonB-dependent receptor, partial [Planctomycetaceae bacterium]|nr:TonB-dependent receptor [Planctomycetaceae bacterium]